MTWDCERDCQGRETALDAAANGRGEVLQHPPELCSSTPRADEERQAQATCIRKSDTQAMCTPAPHHQPHLPASSNQGARLPPAHCQHDPSSKVASRHAGGALHQVQSSGVENICSQLEHAGSAVSQRNPPQSQHGSETPHGQSSSCAASARTNFPPEAHDPVAFSMPHDAPGRLPAADQHCSVASAPAKAVAPVLRRGHALHAKPASQNADLAKHFCFPLPEAPQRTVSIPDGFDSAKQYHLSFSAALHEEINLR